MNKFLQLCLDNKAALIAVPGQSFVSNEAGQTIYIRGVIADGFEANAADIISYINRADPRQPLNFRFNTPGGDVFAGKEIAAAIKNYPGKTVGHVDSLCASAGTSIAISCDEVVMSKGAFFMIHNAQGMAFGDKTALRTRADLMEKVELSIVDDYTAKTGKPADEVIAMMEAETWMTHDEALSHGFIDRVAEPVSKVANTWNLTAYAKAPAELSSPEPAIVDDPTPTIVDVIADPIIDPEPAADLAPIPSMSQANKNRLALNLAL